MPEQEKKPEIKPVVTGQVQVKKRNGFQKLVKDVFQADVKTVKGDLYSKILVPWLKKMVSDLGENMVHMLVYGNTRGANTNSGKTNYQKISWRRDDDDDYRFGYSQPNNRNRAVYDIGEIRYLEYDDAKRVLKSMEALVASEYKMVTVAQYLELSGAPSTWHDNDYGWTNLNGAMIDSISTNDGVRWIICLPRPLPIK